MQQILELRLFMNSLSTVPSVQRTRRSGAPPKRSVDEAAGAAAGAETTTEDAAGRFRAAAAMDAGG